MEDRGEFCCGFPDFQRKVRQEYSRFFDGLAELQDLQAKMLQPRAREPLHKVIRHISIIISNSFGAVLFLVVNGYGNDAMRIARSMFEGAVTVGYLRRHPEELTDYFGFHWIRQKRLVDFYQKWNPEQFAEIEPAAIEEIEKNFQSVAPHFLKGKRPRDRWCLKSFRVMTEEVGVSQMYPTLYSWASSMMHFDIGALTSQQADDGDVDVAPSLEWSREALVSAHNTLLLALNEYNEVAQLNFKEQLGRMSERFQEAWKP
jgi:hypothetical protein